MKESYTLSYKEYISPEEENLLMEGIIEEALLAKGMSRMQPFAFFMKNGEETLVAGIKGVLLYGSLYIDLLWVTRQARQKGLGSQLMHAAEKLGRERKCTFALLTTMDWEALPFYQKLGYQIEYVREGYEKNSKMFILRKNL